MAKGDLRFEIVIDAKDVARQIKNLEKTDKNVKKLDKSTDKLNKRTDTYNRLQKGTAQMGMNTTKSFSKMQQNVDGGGGAGGLVRAYALLAANVFALTAAFGVLSRAAQIDTMVESMEIMSTKGGVYVENIARDLVRASGAAVDLATGMRQVALASSAGLSTESIQNLTTIARGAAISLGRDLPDALDRIFRGAIKLEPEILDEIGLFVRVDEASARYAAQIGKTVSALTQYEKRLAFLSDIETQGIKKFEDFAEAVQPDAFTKVAAALADISQEVLTFINKSGLGGFVTFLAESKTLLTGLFAVVAISLLKKAIPALGQFQQNIRNNAADAYKASVEYRQQVIDESNEVTKAEVKKQKDVLKTMKDRQAAARDMATKSKFKAKIGGRDASKEVEKDLRQELKGKKRIDVIEKRILDLKTKQGLKQRMQNKDAKMELANLEEELRITKEIAKQNKKIRDTKAGTKTDAVKGTIAWRNEQKLLNKALGATAQASFVATTETQGFSAGIGKLWKFMKDGNVEMEDGTHKIKGWRRATQSAKGAVNILGSGVQKMMSFMGPAMMFIGMAAPVVALWAKHVGISSKESKKFEESLKALSAMSETLADRFTKQIEGMKDMELTFLEQMKAALAFAKSQQDVALRIGEVSSAFEEFRRTATDWAKWWEGIKKIMGLDKETKAVKQQLDTLSIAVLKAAQGGELGAETLEIFDKAVPGTKAFGLALKEVTDARANLTTKEIESLDVLGQYKPYMDDLIDTTAEFGGSIEDYAFGPELKKSLQIATDEGLLPAIAKMVLWKRALMGSEEAQEALNWDVNKGAEFYEKTKKPLAEQVRILGAFTSAVEGAADSVLQFQSNFMPKTKVDEITGALESLDAALADMTKGNLEEFFKKFDDEDNPIRKVFSKKQIEEFKKGTAESTEVVTQMLEKFQKIQFTMLATQIIEKGNLALRKQYLKLLVEEKDIVEKIEQSKIDTAKAAFTLATADFEALAISKSLGIEVARAIGLSIAGETTIAGIKAKAAKLGITISEAAQLAGAATKEETAEIEHQIALKSKDQNIQKALLKLREKNLAIEKKLLEAEAAGIKLALQRMNLMKRGTTTLSAKQEAKLAIDAAKLKFKMAIQEAEVKKSMIDVEYQLLQIRLDVLKAEGKIGDTAYNKISAAIKKSAQLQTDLQNQIISNAKDQMAIDMSAATSAAFGSNVILGIQTIGDTYKAKMEELKKTQADERFAEATRPGSDMGSMADLSTEHAAERAKLDKEAMMEGIRGISSEYAKAFAKMGPEGELISTAIQGVWAINDAWVEMADTLSSADGALEKGAAVAQFAAQAIGQIGAILAANSKAQIAEIDRQIAAEQKRDGKSKQSLAKITAMEKKKEAMKKKAFEQNKQMMIAQTIMNTASGIMMALNTSGNIYVGMAMAAMTAAMGAAQLSIIKKMQYQGGGGDVAKPAMTALSIGKRTEKVDVSRGASGGELGYLRGQRGMGGAQNFVPTGGAAGLRKGYAEGGVLVGERGPEVIAPRGSYEVTPNDALGGPAGNINFTINAVDAAGVEEVLMQQRGHIIGMIREAANDTGERFLESVDTDVVGVG